jgi:hypothetical protein
MPFFSCISCMPVDGIAGRRLTTEDRNYDGWSTHSRALGFLLPVSPDARGVNFNSTVEKQSDQGTNGRMVLHIKTPAVAMVSPPAASIGSLIGTSLQQWLISNCAQLTTSTFAWGNITTIL